MERVKAHGFLSKTQAFLCFSPLLGLLLHKELVMKYVARAYCAQGANVLYSNLKDIRLHYS